ncbi:major facilitator superfamily domain-containing protein [Dactylonectria estremocensis]|uniref:Major facilitator superfamily domain-containing protein n=1 Tax=Dactylonectria estremocensis TaxID=1079267 RepID=A0A9P9DFS0_9HYPO|nr:major facilitator superfamily domain-containing protein [Dactylonectria estremocensis]
MGLGILENRDGRHVPGTVTLDQSAAQPGASDEGLKRGSGRDSHIVLVPQPSDDPNDPLNWPARKKMTVFTIILLGTAFICVIPAPILNAGIVQVALDLDRSFSDIAKLNGYMLLAVGAVSPIASAFARKYGKRPVFVLSSIIGLIGCLVAEFAGNYNTLAAGRLLQGFGASAYESLCTSVVTDIYFVHQRGFYVALVVFFLSSLSNGVSVLAGLITTRLGWPYNFHILLPFVAIQTLLVFLFVPETVYNRSPALNIDRLGSDLDVSDKEAKADHIEITESKTTEQERPGQNMQIGAEPKPKTFYQQLAIYNGVFTEKSLLSMMLASIFIMLNLIATYNVLVSGLIMAWFVAMSVLAGVMFAAPPWGFDAAAVGYVSAGPLIGGALATVFLALVSDPLIRSMTKRNQGVYEPEFRLVLAAVGGVFSVAGLVGFGHAIQGLQSIYTISTIWGITLFGMSVAASITMGYALDSQPAHAVEIFIMNITFKNFFFYGLTNFIVEWYVTKGAAEVFDVIAGITAFLVLLTVPMYVYGKRYRHHWGHHNLLVKMGLDEDPVTAH